MAKKGRLIILTGFSGAGKDTLMNLFLSQNPHFGQIVTHTTRPKRKGEKHGIDYNFVTKSVFETMIAENQLFEHVIYGNHYKGTTKDQFERVLNGEHLTWRIDMSRAAIIEETIAKRFDPKAGNKIIERTIKVLIRTHPLSHTLKRYKDREGVNSDTSEFEKRFNADLDIWNNHRHRFPNVIVNKTGKQHDAVEEIQKLILR